MLDVINVKGSVITIYALHCQRDTLEKIAERKAHVVVQVKNNQPKLRAAVVEQFQAVFDAGKEKILTEITEKHHGRSEDTSYYISSMSPNHKLLGHYIRQHWRIENSQHYVLDIVFKEDNSRITLDGAVENIALFRRFVMNMLKQCDCGAPSQKVKLKKAGWNDNYRARIFFGL